MTTPLSQPSSSSPPAPATEVRLTTLRGDRLCITCGFNLYGQTVVREPVYGMIMVRCPECSTPASLQEYPLLGKWPGRLAAALAGAWLIVLLAGLFACAGITFGMTEEAVQSGSTRLAINIAQRFSDWYATADEKAKATFSQQWGGTGTGPLPVTAYSNVDSAWWGTVDKRALLADLGGLRYARSKAVIQPLIWCAVAGVCMGLVWSVLLLGLKRTRLVVLALLVVGLAFGFELLWGSLVEDATNRWSTTFLYTGGLAGQLLAPYLVTAALVVIFLSFVVGLWTGRPLIRWLVRLLLPPRLASALSILWIAEGKSLPRPRPQSRTKAGATPS